MYIQICIDANVYVCGCNKWRVTGNEREKERE